MQRFESARHAQRLLFSHGQIHNLFQLRRHCRTATEQRAAVIVFSRPGGDVVGDALAA